jgi:hypothetical protein
MSRAVPSGDALCQSSFAAALREPGGQPPPGLSDATVHRFAAYRNNVAVRLVEALEANFPAVRHAVGGEFFNALAHAYIAEHPPRLPMLTFYGAALPDFLRGFPPVAGIAYLPDLAAIEVARTRAAFAENIGPIPSDSIASLTPQSLAGLKVTLHPAVAVVASLHPIATIWAMNAGALPLAPIGDWQPECAVIARPGREVLIHRLPPGSAPFIAALAAGDDFATAAAAAVAEAPAFDLGFGLASLFNFGLLARVFIPGRAARDQEGS